MTSYDFQAAIEPLPNAGLLKVSGELPVDRGGSPIRGLPGLEGIPKLLALLAFYMKKRTVAAGLDSDIPVWIDLEPMPARIMM